MAIKALRVYFTIRRAQNDGHGYSFVRASFQAFRQRAAWRIPRVRALPRACPGGVAGELHVTLPLSQVLELKSTNGQACMTLCLWRSVVPLVLVVLSESGSMQLSASS